MGMEFTGGALDVVIYPERRDWGFHLPEQHVAIVDLDRRAVLLNLPDRGAEHTLIRFEPDGPETPETRIHVGGFTGNSHGLYDLEIGYPFPEIGDEMARLKNRWERAAGNPANFNAWAPGETHDEFLARRRADIRELERG